MIFSIEGEVVTLLWFQVVIAKRNLRFAAIDRVIVIVQFVQSWSTETCRVGGTETEGSGGIHQRGFGREVIAEGFVVSDAGTDCSREILQELLLMLAVEGEGVGTLVNVA